MVCFSNLLCVIDPTTDEQPALKRAVWYARQSGATLNLLICYYNEFLSGERFFDSTSLRIAREEVLEKLTDRLERMATPLRDEGLVVTTEAVWDHPLHEGILRQASTLAADVVFKDTHHHSTLARSFFTNSDWNMIRTCPVPLWLVKPHDPGSEPTVIASLDPLNEHDKPAAMDGYILQLSKSVAENTGGNVHAFHSFDTRVALTNSAGGLYEPAFLPIHDIERQVRDAHQEAFDAITTKYAIPENRSHLVSGEVHRRLPQLAEELNAAVVVMGAVSRNRLKRFYIGASSESTLEFLPCDLLVVKPPWFRTSAESDVSSAA